MPNANGPAIHPFIQLYRKLKDQAVAQISQLFTQFLNHLDDSLLNAILRISVVFVGIVVVVVSPLLLFFLFYL